MGYIFSHPKGTFLKNDHLKQENPLSILAEARKMGRLYSLPEIIDIVLAQEDTADRQKFSCFANSEENVGMTPAGSRVILGFHGNGLFQYTNDPKALSGWRSIDYFKKALNGIMPDGSTLPIYQLSDLQSQTVLPQQYGVVLDHTSGLLTESRVQNVDELADNPLLLFRAGGRARADKYLNFIRECRESSGIPKYGPLYIIPSMMSGVEGRICRFGNPERFCLSAFADINHTSLPWFAANK